MMRARLFGTVPALRLGLSATIRRTYYISQCAMRSRSSPLSQEMKIGLVVFRAELSKCTG